MTTSVHLSAAASLATSRAKASDWAARSACVGPCVVAGAEAAGAACAVESVAGVAEAFFGLARRREAVFPALVRPARAGDAASSAGGAAGLTLRGFAAGRAAFLLTFRVDALLDDAVFLAMGHLRASATSQCSGTAACWRTRPLRPRWKHVRVKVCGDQRGEGVPAADFTPAAYPSDLIRMP
ncbi:MAG: hypothetical protein ACK4PI_03830 [Tepidisphaerales bacterium]